MTSARKDLTTSRILSAAGAVVITSVILLAIGLGFPAPASAQVTPVMVGAWTVGTGVSGGDAMADFLRS